MPWEVRESVVSWANRSRRRPAPRRPDPTRPWYVRVFWIRQTNSTLLYLSGSGIRQVWEMSGESVGASNCKRINSSPVAKNDNGPFIFTCRIQNPDIPRAGRDGLARGGTAGRGGAGQDGMPTGRPTKVTSVLHTLQTMEE